MTKEVFIDSFVTNFLSAWCANNYDECCLYDAHERLYNPPIEDAYDIAEEVWQKIVERKI